MEVRGNIELTPLELDIKNVANYASGLDSKFLHIVSINLLSKNSTAKKIEFDSVQNC
jgi:hypothetical protein